MIQEAENLFATSRQYSADPLPALLAEVDGYVNNIASAVGSLDNSILLLTAKLDAWSSSAIPLTLPGLYNANGNSPEILPGIFAAHGPQAKDKDTESVWLQLPGLGEKILNTAAAFGELPRGLKTLKSSLGMLNEVGEGVKGMETMASVAEGGVTIAEGITAGGEIAATAIGVAEVGAAFGPPGWVLSLAALATFAIANTTTKAPPAAEEMTTDKMKGMIWDGEERDDREKLIKAYHPFNYEGYLAIDRELDSPEMRDDRKKRLYQQMYGSSVLETDAILFGGVLPDRKGEKTSIQKLGFLNTKELANEVAAIKARWAYESFGGPINTKGANKEIAALYKKNKVQQAVEKAASAKEVSVRLATEEELEDYNLKKQGLPAKSAVTGRTNRGVGSYLLPVPGNGGRTITINLNKPMIEHFTINTNEIKKGLNDFKHKVEEVLLEILNSANAIQ